MQEKLVKQFIVDGKTADVGSDWHFELHAPQIVARIAKHILQSKRSDVLFLMGDLFETAHGEDSSHAINTLLEALAKVYKHIVFTPGNHDLRGREKPWKAFSNAPKNVITPPIDKPIVWDWKGTKVLVANLFYDMDFIDPTTVGLSPEEVTAQYATSNDGKHFLKGDVSDFPRMTAQAAKKLTPDIAVIATHSLPHPSLVTFRVPAIHEAIDTQMKETGLQFTADVEDDKQRAAKRNTTPEIVRKYWNTKSIFMGSNVIGNKAAQPRDGLVAIHGHHHRNDLRPRVVNGKRVSIISHQLNQQDPQYRIELP